MSNQLRIMKISLAELHRIDWRLKKEKADLLENLISEK